MDITQYYSHPNEKPLDVIKPDGGFFSIFRKVACIGDSLSSGEMETVDETGKHHYYDWFEYSWGQYMARAAGVEVINFSKGGMTAKEYCQSFAQARGFWDPQLACQAYIVALGVNDIINCHMPIGTVADVNLENPTDHPDTFCGWYGEILVRYRQIAPKARLFLMTMSRWTPNLDEQMEAHAKALYQIAELFDFAYVLDFFAYGPVHDEEYHKYFYMGGHLNAAGYLMTAQQTMSYIDYVIRNHPEDFMQVALIGKEDAIPDCHYKW